MSCENGDTKWFTLTWKIKNFSLLLPGDIANLSSPLWYTESTATESKKWWEIQITYADAFEWIIFTLSDVTDKCGPEQIDMSIISSCFDISPTKFKSHDFVIEKSDIFGDNAEKILPGDTLTVCCKIGQKTMKAGHLCISSVLQVQSANVLFKFDEFNSITNGNCRILEKDGMLFRLSEFSKNLKEGTAIVVLYGVPGILGCLGYLVNGNLSMTEGNGLKFPSKSIYPGWRFNLKYTNIDTSHNVELRSVFAVHQTDHPTQLPPSSSKEVENMTKLEAVPGSSTAMSDDFLLLYREGILCDATLNTEGKSFAAHKNILSARSKVFRSMFEKEHQMSEGRDGVVDIEDIDSNTVDRMLIFIYGNFLEDLQWEEALALYYAADKYAIQALKQKCVDVLRAGLSSDNVCDALVLADRHCDAELLGCAVDFISDHEEVVSSPAWDQLEESNPRLTSKIARDLFVKRLKK